MTAKAKRIAEIEDTCAKNFGGEFDANSQFTPCPECLAKIKAINEETQ